jgi:hypothetical protein
MFGQSNNAQNTNSNSVPVDATAAPPNPFAENDMPVPAVAAPSVVEAPANVTPPASTIPATPSAPAPSPGGDDLLGLKQQALQSLQPLISHLDQSPEEKFKTTMMLIQASDNSALVKQAYQAASQITDEKARAQALLDVVNEINYFTHKDSPDTEVKA